jgi:hypothetical protein
MARKSSKTAHVMNLLAGEDSDTSKSEAAKENIAARLNTDSSETIKELTVLAHQASIQTQEGPLSPSPISIIDMSSSTPDPVSELIRQQLNEEEEFAPNQLESDLTMHDQGEELLSVVNAMEVENEVSVISEPGEDEEKEPSAIVTASEVKIYATPTPDDSEVKDNQVPAGSDISTPEAKAVPESIISEEKEELKTPVYQYLNVMENVVRSIVDDYAAKFDACTCGRCIADITALALTKLPPKYIVVESPSASPLLNFYTNRYSQQVIVELTKACSIVKQNPHH